MTRTVQNRSDSSSDPHSEGRPTHSIAFTDRYASRIRILEQPLGIRTASVYYPCCGMDLSVRLALPYASIQFIDSDPEVAAFLRAAGYDCVCTDAAVYGPLRLHPRVVVLLNPDCDIQLAANSVQPPIPATPEAAAVMGGYVICNDIRRTASIVRAMEHFRLVAMAYLIGNGVIYEAIGLDLYWKPVETDEELVATGRYQTFRQILMEINGRAEHIVEEYKRLLEQALEATQWDPGAKKSIADSSSMKLEWKGKTLLLPPLPSQKGTADDLFVFQRIA